MKRGTRRAALLAGDAEQHAAVQDVVVVVSGLKPRDWLVHLCNVMRVNNMF